MLLHLVGGDIELGIARKDILNAAGAVDPGDAVVGRGRLRRRRSAEPPRGPAAGRPDRRRILARDAPARIIVEAVGEREREFVGRVQGLDRPDLRVGETLIAALARGAAQRLDLEGGLAADGVLNQLIVGAVGLVACRPHGLTDELHLRRIDPARTHGDETRPRAGVLQADPVDDGDAGEDAVEIIRVALRHGQAFAAALGRAHEVHLLGFLAVGAVHQPNSRIAHLLVGAVSEILEGFVIQRKDLRRLALLGLVARVSAVGDEASSQRRRLVEGRGRRQRKTRDQHAVETAAAILQRATVPFDGKVDLKSDRRRLGVDRVDMAEHLAEAGIGRRDASDGVGRVRRRRAARAPAASPNRSSRPQCPRRGPCRRCLHPPPASRRTRCSLPSRPRHRLATHSASQSCAPSFPSLLLIVRANNSMHDVPAVNRPG